jgi:hypothetical protein
MASAFSLPANHDSGLRDVNPPPMFDRLKRALRRARSDGFDLTSMGGHLRQRSLMASAGPCFRSQPRSAHRGRSAWVRSAGSLRSLLTSWKPTSPQALGEPDQALPLTDPVHPCADVSLPSPALNRSNPLGLAAWSGCKRYGGLGAVARIGSLRSQS